MTRKALPKDEIMEKRRCRHGHVRRLSLFLVHCVRHLGTRLLNNVLQLLRLHVMMVNIVVERSQTIMGFTSFKSTRILYKKYQFH